MSESLVSISYTQESINWALITPSEPIKFLDCVRQQIHPWHLRSRCMVTLTGNCWNYISLPVARRQLSYIVYSFRGGSKYLQSCSPIQVPTDVSKSHAKKFQLQRRPAQVTKSEKAKAWAAIAVHFRRHSDQNARCGVTYSRTFSSWLLMMPMYSETWMRSKPNHLFQKCSCFSKNLARCSLPFTSWYVAKRDPGRILLPHTEQATTREGRVDLKITIVLIFFFCIVSYCYDVTQHQVRLMTRLMYNIKQHNITVIIILMLMIPNFICPFSLLYLVIGI